MSTYFYETSLATNITDEQRKEHATLFSENYGLWGQNGRGKPGTRLKATPRRLKTVVLFDDQCAVARCLEKSSGKLIGIVTFRIFAYPALKGDGIWISQLVVDKSHRNKRIATTLLTTAIRHFGAANIVIAGVASTHPYTIKALLTASGGGIDKLFMKIHSADLMLSSRIPYLQPPNNELRGRVFGKEDREGSVAFVDSHFNIDHGEVNEALDGLEKWELGTLEVGCEFLMVVAVERSD